MTTIERNVDALPAMPFTSSLQAMVKNIRDVGQFSTAVGNWYDDHMDRVSGWYKRHIPKSR